MPNPTSPTLDPAQRVRRLIERTRDDPAGFSEAILNRPLLPHQIKIAESVLRYRRTIVSAANSVGKDYTAANVIWQWLCTRPGSLVLCTAPSQNIVGNVLFKNLRTAHQNARIPLGGTITESGAVSPQRIVMDPRIPEWGALGFATTTSSVARASGHHNPELLVVVDEASDVEEATWEAVASLNYKSLLAIGNPLRALGKFRSLYDQAAGDPESNAIKISVYDTPHHTWDRSPIGLPDKTYIDAMKAEWGADSLWVRVHLDAEFPTVDSEELVDPAWLDACTRVPKPTHVGKSRWIGADPSKGSGADRTAVCVRDENQILEMHLDNTLELGGCAALVARLARKYEVPDDHVIYDRSEVVGGNLADFLYPLGITNPTPYHGSFSGGAQYANMRAFAAHSMKRRLDPRLPNHVPFYIPAAHWYPALREEMLQLRTVADLSKIKLELRTAMAARLGHSPDALDCFMCTFSQGDDLPEMLHPGETFTADELRRHNLFGR